jgi:flagellar protein FliS
MVQSKPWQSYRQVATQTASPGQLVLMLYDGAIRFLECARTGFGLDDPAEFNQTINNNILRAQAIVNELDTVLNMEAGGPFADKLRALYRYMDARLQEANAQKQEAGVVEVIRHITTLRDAWAEMLRSNSITPQAVGALSAAC